MAIVKEQEVKKTLKAKGILLAIDDDGLRIKDKEGDVETLSYEDFRMFQGGEINLSVSESSKSGIF